MRLLRALRRHGLKGTARIALKKVVQHSGWHEFRTRKAPEYPSPGEQDLKSIEAELSGLGVVVEDYRVNIEAFWSFMDSAPFPTSYAGGPEGGVWEEKHMEHFIALQLLDIDSYRADDIYVDVAACNSPWARHLREAHGTNAYAVDLAIDAAYAELPYYRRENATHMDFEDNSIRGMSLHCAFEMFMGEDDTRLMQETARTLQPGGRLLILPLYMHTHYCSYATPEYWGKGYADPAATEYVRRRYRGIPSSRKYDAAMLKRRVLDPAIHHGLRYRLLALRNKAEAGRNIYCHFILELSR
jgi:hypothetical protein